MKINSVIKTIKVDKYHQKLIPKGMVTFYFKNQIGLPKNFIYINSSLKRIQRWYYLRGYHLANIILDESINRNNSIIYIFIEEGILNKIEFISYVNTHDFIKINKILSIEFLLSILSIRPKQVFNIKYLKEGINLLKSKKFVVDCHYELIRNNSQQNTWDLVFRLELYSNKSLLLHNSYINIRFYIDILFKIISQNSHELIIYKSTNSYINLFTLPLNTKYFIDFLTNRFNLTLTSYDHLSKVYINLYNYFMQSCSTYYNFFIYFVFNQYIDCKYTNVSKVNQYFILHTIILSKITYLYINYQNVWINKINLNHNQYNKNIVCYFNINCVYNTNYSFLSLHNFNRYLFYRIVNLHIQFINQISNVYYSMQEISIRFFDNQYIFLYNYITKYKLNNNILHENYNARYYNLKIIQEYQIQRFCKIFISCIFSNLNTFIYNIQIRSINLQYTFWLLKKLVNYNLYENLDINHKLYLSIKQTYWINRSFIIYQINLIQLLNFKCFSFFSDIYYMIDTITIRGYKNYVFLLSSNVVLFNLEYKVPLKNQYKFFVFIDYMKHLNVSKSIYNNLLFLPSYWFNYHLLDNLKIGYGIGIEFVIPIDNAPSVNVAFGCNIHGKYSVNLSITQNNNKL